MISIIFASLLLLNCITNSGAQFKETSNPVEQCGRRYADKNSISFDTYWINLEKSEERREATIKYFEFLGITNHHRIPAITPGHIDLPPNFGRFVDCKFTNRTELNERLHTLKTELSATNNTNHAVTKLKMKRVYLTGYCERPKTSETELAVTLSHLLAIDRAVHNENSKTKYALIMEDDLQFVFEIDFEGLIASAPEDFAVLQLVTINHNTTYTALKDYVKDNKYWTQRTNHPQAWSTAAYIIDKEKLKPVISSLIEHEEHGIILANVMAVDSSLRNKGLACWNHAGPVPDLPCVDSPLGYQADNFIFNLFREETFLITIPIMTASKSAEKSTVHQKHIDEHLAAFREIKSATMYLLFPIYHQEIHNASLTSILPDYSGRSSLPPFLHDDCIRACEPHTHLCQKEIVGNLTYGIEVIKHVQTRLK